MFRMGNFIDKQLSIIDALSPLDLPPHEHRPLHDTFLHRNTTWAAFGKHSTDTSDVLFELFLLL